MTLTYEQARSNAERIADEELKQRVLRGMEVLLRDLGPEWPDQVDPEALLMQSPTECVLGQLYDGVREMTDDQVERIDSSQSYKPLVAVPGFFKGMAILDGEVQDTPSEFGFDNDPATTDCVGDYEALTEAWMTVFGEEL